VAEQFETFHFAPDYDVEVNPEFPGDGHWAHPVYGFGRDGTVMEDFDSRWGTPTVVQVIPTGSSAWVGMFAAGGLGRLREVYACPAPQFMCTVVDGLAYLTDVSFPTGTTIAHDQVTQVVAVGGRPLLLFVSFDDIVAIGAAAGIAWRTPRLVVDGLRVVTASADGIVCTGDNLGGTETIELDPATGAQTAGTRMDSFWPPDALG
jgi:hypothetical protein